MLIDRPAVRIAPGFEVTAGAPGSFRAGHDPQAFTADGAERYDRVLATVPNDVFERMLAPGLLPDDYLERLRSIEYFAALCLLLELDRPSQPLLLDQRRRPRAAVRRADRAHQLRRAGALRRPPLPVRRQLPRARPRAARARRRRAAGALPARPAAGQPGVRPLVGEGVVAAPRAGRAADRHGRLPRADPGAARRRSRDSCSRTPRRSIPRIGAPTTPCASATRRPRRCSSERARRRRRRHVHGRGAGRPGRHDDREGALDAEPGGGRGGGRARGARARRRRRRRGDALRARLDGRHQRAARAPARAHRARDHQGVPRPAVPRPPGAAQPLPPARGADAAGGRAAAVRRGRRADGAGGRAARARRGERAPRRAAARPRARRGGGRVPAVRVPRSRARGARGGDPARRRCRTRSWSPRTRWRPRCASSSGPPPRRSTRRSGRPPAGTSDGCARRPPRRACPSRT